MADKTNASSARKMPYNIEAEESVLGAILIDNKAADIIVPSLKEEDFYLPQNRTIFAAMRALQEDSKPIDTVSISDLLDSRKKLDEVGSIDYLTSLASAVPSAANAEYYAEIVRRDSLSRRVINAGNDITKAAYEMDDGAESLENAERIIYKISEGTIKTSLNKADDALSREMKAIQNMQTGNVPTNVVYSDFPSLDKWTKGFKPGELILLAARPSVGKTAFALNVAARVCLKHKKRVAVFCLEMPDQSLVKRMLAYVSGVTMDEMDKRGGLSNEANGRLFKAYNELLAAELYIDDYSMNTASDILSKCRRLKREKNGLDLIIVDYLQLMTADKSGRKRSADSRQEEVADLSRRMKVYAKELDLPILVLSQLSRGVESTQRGDHKPQLSDLRESGAIEQDADVVMFLHKPFNYDQTSPENLVQLIIRKNRNGSTGEIDLDWDGATTSFREYEKREAVEDVVAPKRERKDGDDLASMKEVVGDDAPFDVDGNFKADGNDGKLEI